MRYIENKIHIFYAKRQAFVETDEQMCVERQQMYESLKINDSIVQKDWD
jgi:hypothetical protein